MRLNNHYQAVTTGIGLGVLITLLTYRFLPPNTDILLMIVAAVCIFYPYFQKKKK